VNNEKRDFDKEAASWDENPARVNLAREVANAISTQIVLMPHMDVMDFGCGTGLLTARIQPLVRSVTGVDSSRGMLDILNMKIDKLKLSNVSTVLVDPDRGDALAGSYDLVLSNMTLHHIKEIEPLFAQFYKITKSAGYLCIADLDSDEGRFHEDNSGVFHSGFDRNVLRKIFTETGFENVRDTTAAEVVKPVRTGEMRRFTIFLMNGRKRAENPQPGT
jgi:ubiquinone/menaquinone biosynthesis C-methylase UbiE